MITDLFRQLLTHHGYNFASEVEAEVIDEWSMTHVSEWFYATPFTSCGAGTWIHLECEC